VGTDGVMREFPEDQSGFHFLETEQAKAAQIKE